LPSILLHCEDQNIRTKKLRGHFRSLAWNRQDQCLIVGNRGRILRMQDDELIDLDSGTRQNLRGVSVNPSNGTALIAGNEGTLLSLDEEGRIARINTSTSENLRATAWNDDGSVALVVGNRGVILRHWDHGVRSVDGGRANLRHVAWRPNRDQALITSNCFAEEFIPSPNLFSYDARTDHLSSLNEGRVDLIGVHWAPSGESALVVGYDVVWHNGFIGVLNGTSISPIQFENKHVYPVNVAWNPAGKRAAIATATTQPGIGKGTLYLWDEKSLKTVYSNDQYFFSAIAWNREGKRLVALASDATRTFNC
jgi:WD40 repeat protein